MDLPSPIHLGISACLMGDPVRYEGGHKRLSFATDALAQHFEFVKVCPEKALGLGVPRPTIRLVGSAAAPRLQRSDDPAVDLTHSMTVLARDTAQQLDHISGYIFCAKSPRCGMERVPVVSDDGHSLGKVGVGVYARELMASLPLLPVEENGRLNDARLRENFVLRVVAYARWQAMMAAGLTRHALQEFHRRHKFLLLAHHQRLYRQLGPLVAAPKDLQRAADDYIALFMAALKQPASPSDHTNTLMHIQGFFKNHLDREDRAQLSQVIGEYADGLLPLLVPLEMLTLFLKKYQIDYLLDQYYFEPYPRDLKLRLGL